MSISTPCPDPQNDNPMTAYHQAVERYADGSERDLKTVYDAVTPAVAAQIERNETTERQSIAAERRQARDAAWCFRRRISAMIAVFVGFGIAVCTLGHLMVTYDHRHQALTANPVFQPAPPQFQSQCTVLHSTGTLRYFLNGELANTVKVAKADAAKGVKACWSDAPTEHVIFIFTPGR